MRRPNYVRVKALDRDMNEFELEAEELFARAICHECEHLDGHMYVEKVAGGVEGLVDNEELYKDED